MANKKSSKVVPPFLRDFQIAHLIENSVKNLVDLKFHDSENGTKFLIIPECVNPEGCIPPDEETESDDDLFNLMDCHAVVELSDYFEAVLTVHLDGKPTRAFGTIEINEGNIVDFVHSLAELESYWDGVDQQIENEEEMKLQGKNFVQGNGTVN